MNNIQQLVVDLIRVEGGQKEVGQHFEKSRQLVGHWSHEDSTPERLFLVEMLQLLREHKHPRYAFLNFMDCESLLGFSLNRTRDFILSFEEKPTPAKHLSEGAREVIGVCGEAVQQLALSLLASPSWDERGSYYRPLPAMALETGLAVSTIELLLDLLQHLDFCTYEPGSERVYVPLLAKLAHYLAAATAKGVFDGKCHN